ARNRASLPRNPFLLLDYALILGCCQKKIQGAEAAPWRRGRVVRDLAARTGGKRLFTSTPLSRRQPPAVALCQNLRPIPQLATIRELYSYSVAGCYTDDGLRTMDPQAFLVGAGPGHAGLLTLRAVECLAQADLVLYDRLVPRQLLEHAPAHAER